jgi:hypothetical protein
MPERPEVVGKIRGIQHLNACIMLTVKWSHGSWAASFLGIRRIVKPQSKMIHLDWASRRICSCVRECIVKNKRCRSTARCYNKSLYTKTANKNTVAMSMPVSFNIALVPDIPNGAFGT